MRAAAVIGCCFLIGGAAAQCTNYQITVTGGTFPLEIDWEFVDGGGGTWASGGAPATQTVCLTAGCYSMYMFDSFGDGWNGATWTVQQLPAMTTVASGTLTNGVFGTVQVNIGGGCGGPCSNHTLTVSGGTFPAEVSWNLIGATGVIATGFAPWTVSLCVDTGCYYMDMYDSFGDGWNGATWSLINSLGAVVAGGTLSSGSQGQSYFAVGVNPVNCGPPPAVTASDCADAVNICTNYTWAVDPNGIGALNEIPPLGSIGNPDFLAADLVPSPWGTDNYGCLRNNELNSTWMIINVSGGGSLEFTFGGFGTQAGFYDWIMYPYTSTTCTAVMANTVAPVRCNWNGSTTGGTGLASALPPGGNALNYEPPLMVTAGQQYLICFSNWSSVTTTVPLEFGGTATVSCDPFILPVELLAFQATATAAGVRLNWTTATESDVQHFVVERAPDAVQWVPLTTVDAVGQSNSTVNYAWTDRMPLTGTNYYRITSVDLDGSATSSAIESVEWAEAPDLVHPNPSTGIFRVANHGGTVRVTDATGRAVPCRVEAGDAMFAVVTVDRPGLFSVCAGDGRTMRCERVLVE